MGYKEKQRRKLWEASLSHVKGSTKPKLRSVETNFVSLEGAPQSGVDDFVL
jgi:hypothetical protein